MKIPILTYHSWLTNGQAYAGDDHIALASDLAAIKQLGLKIVPLERIVDALLSNRLHELENQVGLSFDDGMNFDVEDTVWPNGEVCPGFLKILQDFGKYQYVHATSFVIGSAERTPLPGSADPGPPDHSVTRLWQKAEQSGLIKIENHGWRHFPNPPVDVQQAADQIEKASRFIDSILGPGYCRLFAYPFGRPNAFLAADYLPRNYARHGIKAAFTTDPKPVSHGENRWLIPRYICGRDWTSQEELKTLLREGRSRPLSIRRQPAQQPPPAPPPAIAKPGVSTYQDAWDARAHSEQAAMAAVDGSVSEDVLQLTGRFAARKLKLALNLEKSDSILELGCGVGRIGREIAPHCAHWTGADISSNMLNVAKRRLATLSSVDFVHLKRTVLAGVPNNSLDKAYSVAVFCHMDKEDMFLYLLEFARTLKPGGWLYFETWNLAHPVGWKRWAYEVRHWEHASQTVRKDISRNQFSVPEEIKLLTRKAGFKIGACYSDSPWVQMIAFKPAPGLTKKANRKYLESHARDIAFDEEFSNCFSRQLDLVYGAIGPRNLLDWLNALEDSENVTLFRQYLLGLWDTNKARWGEPPADQTVTAIHDDKR